LPSHPKLPKLPKGLDVALLAGRRTADAELAGAADAHLAALYRGSRDPGDKGPCLGLPQAYGVRFSGRGVSAHVDVIAAALQRLTGKIAERNIVASGVALERRTSDRCILAPSGVRLERGQPNGRIVVTGRIVIEGSVPNGSVVLASGVENERHISKSGVEVTGGVAI